MTDNNADTAAMDAATRAAVEAAIRALPPAWPLHASVAVNPFLGQAHEPLEKAQARLRRVAGTRITPPRRWYRERLEAGALTRADLARALDARWEPSGPEAVVRLVSAMDRPAPAPSAVPTVADLARAVSGMDWPGFIAERIGAWAAGHFDQGQALWAAPEDTGAYTAWRWVATQDLTPEIEGLRRFTRHVADAPDTAERAIARAVERLRLPPAALETAFHRLLMTLGGWSQYARYRLWQAELAGDTDRTAMDLLAIRLIWEEALLEQYGERVARAWDEAVAAHAAPVSPDTDDHTDAVLQAAVERGEQRRLAGKLAAATRSGVPERPALQAAFCIDVRSEVFRRALESVNPHIQTLGFAGFFGVATEHRRFASDVAEARAPALLNPAVRSRAGGPDDRDKDRRKRLRERMKRAWGRFKLAAVSSFAFVEAMGPVYFGKLVRDGVSGRKPDTPQDPAPQLDSALDGQTRTDMAEQVLRALSLTEGFAPVVLFVGHGAGVVNNPHASALQCGACGGYSGDVNARLLAGLLNDAEVRSGLSGRGIEIPAGTVFVGGFHDTTSDRVQLYDGDPDVRARGPDLAPARQWLAAAGAVARGERMPTLPRSGPGARPDARARDWSEVRPEWGLAGCQALVAAPRARTAGSSLAGRAFLHDYDWHQDQDYAVLEQILTAPVVVASWISLQYYGSTVAPETFGAGNKVLHNVTGGLGVVEGNGGLMRAGLPWQSVQDGERWVHEPLRLTVCLEAPRQAITRVLERHPEVRTLFDQGWLHLLVLDAQGQAVYRYLDGGQWQTLEDEDEASNHAAARA